MGRAKVKLEMKEPQQQMPTYNKRKVGIAKKARELSILCDTEVLLLSIDPKGKADLVLGPNTNFEGVVNWFADASPKERSQSKLEGIQILKKVFKRNNHEIDVQQLMNPRGSGSSHAMQLGQQSSINMTKEIQQMQNLCALLENTDKLHMIDSKDHLNLMEDVVKNLLQLNKEKKIEMSNYRNRDRASASAFQQLTDQAVLNHPGPPNGNPMNNGTNLLQPNMNLGSNSGTVSDFLMAAPPEIKEENLGSNSGTVSDLLMAAPPEIKEENLGSNSGTVSDLLMAAPPEIKEENLGSNSGIVSDLLMAASPGIKEEAAYHSPDAFDDDFLAHEWSFGACFPGN